MERRRRYWLPQQRRPRMKGEIDSIEAFISMCRRFLRRRRSCAGIEFPSSEVSAPHEPSAPRMNRPY